MFPLIYVALAIIEFHEGLIKNQLFGDNFVVCFQFSSSNYRNSLFGDFISILSYFCVHFRYL